MARAARSRHVWTPLLPAISDRNRNKSKISEFVTGASQNSEANHASFTSRRLSCRRHPQYSVSGGNISFCRLGVDLRGVPMVEQPRNPPASRTDAFQCHLPLSRRTGLADISASAESSARRRSLVLNRNNERRPDKRCVCGYAEGAESRLL